MRTLFASMVVASTAVGFAVSAHAETWDMPTPYPEGNYLTQNVIQFAKDVKELSGGKLEITVHSGASLFKMPEIKRAVRTGQAQIGEILLSAYGNENAIFEVDGVPFLAAGFDNAEKLWKAQKPILTEVLAEEGLIPLFTGVWPGQGLYNQAEIESLDAMQGVKFRAYNAATSRLAELMGAVPTTVQYAEVPQAFSTGVVSAMLTSATTGVDVKAWDFLKVFYTTDAMHPKNLVFVSKSAFDGLDKDVQDAIMTAAANAEKRVWAQAREEGAKAAKTLADNGMTVKAPGDKLQSELQAIGTQMTKEWVEKAGERGQKLVDAYNAM
ncbi:MAG: TRAP transporter substrate-binding protein [Alphaproteobacteria bacterium]|nr:TRAP transporter substrate-binding protein [Alphaproteobacteria bacterium]MDX5368735.1 TRAP transporter substrate-binding protein [Alphaproteobacteria bacterium]MDX5463477.1 TRAP transporter substrate-binding protein [Alphaproteobacteria bacterium]